MPRRGQKVLGKGDAEVESGNTGANPPPSGANPPPFGDPRAGDGKAGDGKSKKGGGGKGNGKADNGLKGPGKAENGGDVKGHGKADNGWKGKADNARYPTQPGDGKGPRKGDNGWKGGGKADNGGYPQQQPSGYPQQQPTGDGKGYGKVDNSNRKVPNRSPAQMGNGNGYDHGGTVPPQRGGPAPAPGRGGRPLELSLPSHGEGTSTPPHPTHLWPITPLGLPRTPPPLPPVNPHLGSFFLPQMLEAMEDHASPSLPSNAIASGGKAPALPPGRLTAPEPSQWKAEEEFVPVSEQQAKGDRRTYFHTEGRSLSYNPMAPDHRKRIDAQGRHEMGVDLDLKVEEVHFGNPRVRIMQGDPAPMPQMLKWPTSKYDEFVLECAEVDFGDFRVWSAVGIRSNRLLYAMKRLGVVRLKAVVVQPPVPETEDDVDLTYGASIQAIQLVP